MASSRYLLISVPAPWPPVPFSGKINRIHAATTNFRYTSPDGPVVSVYGDANAAIQEILPMTASSRLQGVLAPVLTPMHDDLSPDTAKWIAFCRQLLADGCTGLAPFGTTSEANSLALEERMEMLAALWNPACRRIC
jgi:hypothetical protein